VVAWKANSPRALAVRSLEIKPCLTHSICMQWTVYVIRCDDGTLYTGVTTDLARRFDEHLRRPRGAKYFSGRKPREVVYSENGHTRSSACRREAAIKKLSRAGKLNLVRREP
jgi:putative endonuclease